MIMQYCLTLIDLLIHCIQFNSHNLVFNLIKNFQLQKSHFICFQTMSSFLYNFNIQNPNTNCWKLLALYFTTLPTCLIYYVFLSISDKKQASNLAYIIQPHP